MTKRTVIFISLILSLAIYTNNNEISNIHFVFLADVSGSMEETYNNNELEIKSNKIYDLLENITEELSSKNSKNALVSGILFGTQKKGEIADLISLTDLASRSFNFPKVDNSKERLISLLESYGAISIKNFMYKDISPNEKECNFFYNILKDDSSFCYQIVESLPYQCKDRYYEYEKYGVKGGATLAAGALSLVNPFLGAVAAGVTYYFADNKISGTENDSIINEINQKLKKCIMHKLKEPLNSFEWDKKNYQSKPAKEVLNSIKILKDKIPSRNNIIDSFSDYIYGYTPLKKAIEKTYEIIKKDSENTIKIIVILSDGLSTDGNPNDLKNLIKQKKNTYIVTLYFSSDKVSQPKQLYFRKPYGNEGLEQLYDLASEINPYCPIFDMLEERGWKVDYTQKSKLFLMANSIDIFEEFINVLNSFVNGNILGNMISKIELNEYITFYNKDHRINEKQKGGICWCHSLSKVIEYASHRIYRGRYLEKYPYPVFSELRDNLIEKYKPEGKKISEFDEILDKTLPKYFLRYSKYSNSQEEKIKIALMKGRPLVFTYFLSEKQWTNFSNFFKKNKKGILTTEILNRGISDNSLKNDEREGHAVILIEYNEDGYICLNSWGESFGDKGKFRIKTINVLGDSVIYDVYFYERDLPNDLKKEWNWYSQQNEKKFKEKYY